MTKKVLIFGVTGQDGSYLLDNLLARGYEVHGLYRHTSVYSLARIAGHVARGSVRLHRGDVTDPTSVDRVIKEVRPDLLFNMADQDSVDWSYLVPQANMDVTLKAVLTILEVLKGMGTDAPRFFQPVSALMFGEGGTGGLDERAAVHPKNPYAIAKTAAYFLCKHYREAYKVWVSCGILFNHDSERRASGYLLHRICEQAVLLGITAGRTDDSGKIRLGMLDMRVDVGYAPEYCEAMLRAALADTPDDYVIGSGRSYTILEMVYHALQHAGVFFPQEGKRVVSTEQALAYVEVDDSFIRPGQGNPWLVAYPHKAKQRLGWESSTHVPDLTRILVAHYRSKWIKHEFKPLALGVREDLAEEDE